MRFPKTLLAAAPFFAFAGLLGCGGGGSASGSLSLFISDDLNAGYDGVWVKIKKLEVLTASGAVAVFDNPAGKVVNLRALNSGGNAEFLFIGEDRIDTGDYTGARATLAKDVVLFPTGQAAGQSREFAGLDGNGNKVLDVTFAAPKTVSASGANFIIDFKLSDWSDDGTKIQSAKIEDGSAFGFDDPARHEEDDFTGTISSLQGAAPDFRFNLNTTFGVVIPVVANASTAIFNSDGTPSPLLANGKRVEVRGTFSPVDGALVAASIKVKAPEDPDDDPHQVKGPTSAFDANAGTIEVTIREAEGFIPDRDSITVQVSPEATRFFSHGGLVITQAEFFAALQSKAGMPIEAEGTVTGTGDDAVLSAKKVKLEDEDDFGEAEAKGGFVSKNEVAGTIVISLIEWEGFSGTAGQQITVHTDDQTVFTDDNGVAMTSAQFFAALLPGAKAEVKGTFDEGALHAIRAKLEDLNENDAEARGVVKNLNGTAFTFDIVLSTWFGFAGEVGMTVHVNTTGATTFRGFDGETMTRDAFFAALTNGAIVETEGLFDTPTSTLTAAKAKLED